MRETVKLIILLSLVVSVGRFSLDSYLPSLPSIVNFFNANDGLVQLTLTYYFFGFGASQIIYGPLSEKFGRKFILLCGMSIFLIGCLICFFSKNLDLLIFGRSVTGIGAGSSGVIARAIVSDAFHSNQVAQAWSKITTAIVLSLIIGPMVGSYIQVHFSFQDNFLVSFFYGILIYLLIWKFLPETKKTFTSSQLTLPIIIKNYSVILKDMHFILYIIFSTLAFGLLSIYFQLSPFIFIKKFHYSYLHYGYILWGVAISYVCGGKIVRVITKRMSSDQAIFIGAFVILLGSGLLLTSYLSALKNILILIGSFVFVVGTRIIVPIGLSEALKNYKHLSGYASALAGGGQMLGGSFLSYCIAKSSADPCEKLTLALFFVSVLIGGALWVKFIRASTSCVKTL